MSLNFIDLKSELHRQCLAIVNQRIAAIRMAIAEAQATANSETKSSAGDKYETTRSMMQLDIEQNAAQLAEAIKLKDVLQRIDPVMSTVSIQPGSLVVTNNGNFYIAVSVGALVIQGETYVVLSPASPVGALMMGMKTGHQFVFNKKTFEVQHVF
jgi:hypothetical protein